MHHGYHQDVKIMIYLKIILQRIQDIKTFLITNFENKNHINLSLF